MPIVTTRCVVLQVHRYSDTSKILRLLTFEHGPVSVIARGALRPRSRLSGLLEPFTEGMATFYLRRNRDLHTLSGFELIHDRQALGSDLVRFGGASVLCELVLRVAPREADPYLFETLVDGLDALMAAGAGEVERVALIRIWRLVALLGFAPSVEACVECGRTISDRARFDLRAGGLRCWNCIPAGQPLEAGEIADLRALVAGEAVAVGGSRQVGLLADFIRYHASEGYRIRSLDFLGFDQR